MKPLVARIRDRCEVETATGCWIWKQGTTDEGYPQIQLTALFGRRSYKVRRLVYAIACGPLTSRQMVTAVCENPLCCAPLHLRAMAPGQFARTGFRKSRQSRGIAHGIAVKLGRTRPYKLDGKAAEIRARLAAGESQTALAKEYGVHKTTISHLWCGKSWAQESPFGGLRK
jgi:hypothetical protein